MSSLTTARASTSAKLRGLELPSCFAESTLAAALREDAKPTAKRNRRDARRLNDHVARLVERGEL